PERYTLPLHDALPILAAKRATPDDDAQLSLPPGPMVPGQNGARPWRLPAVELFKLAPAVELSQSDVKAQARTIEETLQSFNIQRSEEHTSELQSRSDL